MSLARAITEWQALLGSAEVLIGDACKAAYGVDTSGSRRAIPAALLVRERTSIPSIVLIANRYRIPIYPISTGHNWGYGGALPFEDHCVIVDLSNLQAIVHFDAELGVVTVEPGVTQQILANFLDAGNHPYMVPVTGAGPTCSLVGNALERGYGITPETDHFAAVTDIEAVLADGSLYQTTLREVAGDDLARLFKWGLGPYTVGLFTQNGLGIVTRMSILLAHRPECVKVCLFSLARDELLEPATERLRILLRQLPSIIGGVNLMNRHRVFAMTAPFPSDKLGVDGMIPAEVVEQLGADYRVEPWTGFVTLYGTDRLVRAAQWHIKEQLGDIASRMIFVSKKSANRTVKILSRLPILRSKRIAATVRTLAASLTLAEGRPNELALALAYWRNTKAIARNNLNPSRDGCGLIWYSPLVPMRSANVRRYVDLVVDITHKHQLEPLITLTSMNSRLFDSTVPLLFDISNSQETSRAKECLRTLVNAGREIGCFPYRLGIDTMNEMRAGRRNSAIFHRRIRESLDINNIMAPGRYR